MGANRSTTVALFALAIAPSAYFAWHWRDMAHLGAYHDDALYLVGAKSLAEGSGYRIESLPGQPFQTKYPPVFAALIAPLWKYGPAFPKNLPLLTLFAWLMTPAYLFFARATFRNFGLGHWETWLLTFAAALHPIVLLLGMSLMPDLLFLALFLASLELAERALTPTRPGWLAAAAGVLGGVAYLTRTSALPIALTAPLCFLLAKRYVRAALFLSGMLPAVVGWQVWTSRRLLRTSDPSLMYYTSYVGMERATVHWDNLATVLWHNLDGLLRAIARLIVFDVIPIHPHLQQVIGVAAMVGIFRLAKRTRRLQYPAAAAGFALLLLVYFFPADERILLPVYPLVLAGLLIEGRNFWSAVLRAWRKPEFAERAGAVAAGMALATLAGLTVGSDVLGAVRFLPQVRQASRNQLFDRTPVYDWIRKRTAPAASFYAYDDALLYLYTGRQASGLPAPPGRLYRDDGAAQMRQYALSIPQSARQHELDYLMVTQQDFYRDGFPGLVWKAAGSDPGLELECATAHAAVYRSLVRSVRFRRSERVQQRAR